MDRGKEFVQPAPAGILRVAAWPIDTLADFGSIELADLALAVGDLSGRSLNPSFLALWKKTLEEERQLLWQLTADDPRFLKALLFSNATLFRRVRRYARRWQDRRSKTVRQLEGSLYRYLARAAGRTTPMGLWAGVTAVTFADESRVQQTPARYAVAPDLRPFQVMLRELAGRAQYRQEALWNLNPTLQAHADNGWEFWARLPEGRIERRRMDHDVALEALIDTLSNGERGTLIELSQRIERSARWQAMAADWGPDTIDTLLDALANGGVLVGGLDLQSRFGTPWQALEFAQSQLQEPDRRHWAAALDGLRECCATLEGSLDTAPVSRVEKLMKSAAERVRGLASALDIHLPDIRYPILRCDLGAPFTVSWNRRQRRQLLEAIRAYESCWVDGASPWTEWRRAQHVIRAQKGEQGVQLGSIDDCAASSSISPVLERNDAKLHTQLNAWQSTICVDVDEVFLQPSNDDATVGPPRAPLGCLYVGLQEGFHFVVQGLSDDVATAFARYDVALCASEAISAWLAKFLSDLQSRHGIGIAELTGPFEQSPNALARPILVRPIIDPWGTSRDGENLAGAEIRLDPGTSLPFLRRPHDEKPTAVFWFASANIASTDPIARQLLQTSFHENVGANFQAVATPVPDEIDQPRFGPRVRLPCGSVIRSRRTVIDGKRLRRLAHLSQWQRYVHWQHLAEKHGWPQWLNVSLSGCAPLPMKTSSPLALEALFKGARNCGAEDYLVVEELPVAPWLKGTDGEGYIAELALPFARANHGWSSLPVEQECDLGGQRP